MSALAAKWANMPCLAFDLETTGVDVFEDRIVSAALVRIRPGTTRPLETFQWLANPGVEIPQEAIDVHGITNERAQAEGGHPEEVVATLVRDLAYAMRAGVPVIVANASFDLTMLEAEARRYDLRTLADLLDGKPIGPVIDPMVLDKYVDPYRKADCPHCAATDKKLTSLCIHYGVSLTDAHDAAADATAAGLLWPKIIGRFNQKFRGMTVGALHQAQVGWRRDQMDSLRKYFDRNQIEHDGCDPSWPIRKPVVVEPQGSLL